MNRYKKKVVLKEEAKPFILPRPDSREPGAPLPPAAPVDFSILFGNTNPVEIEAGYGTGRFIIEYASKYPGLNLLGIEITRKMVDHVANKVHTAGLSNVRLLHTDARAYMKERVPEGSVERVHVYFPDPWVKKRHIKRRIINQDFLATVYRVLKPGGRFNFFTDHKDYFDYFIDHKQSFGRFAEDDAIGDYTPTSYEMKWVKMGRTIYRSIMRKP
ncbi:MAG: tRNA (guanosine(46)-N7)-methyltransferase TrmB [Fibrobacterota bacterium]